MVSDSQRRMRGSKGDKVERSTGDLTGILVICSFVLGQWTTSVLFYHMPTRASLVFRQEMGKFHGLTLKTLALTFFNNVE